MRAQSAACGCRLEAGFHLQTPRPVGVHEHTFPPILPSLPFTHSLPGPPKVIPIVFSGPEERSNGRAMALTTTLAMRDLIFISLVFVCLLVGLVPLALALVLRRRAARLGDSTDVGKVHLLPTLSS